MSLFTDEQPQLPERTRVSIIERIVPAISFGLASLSGIVGGLMTVKLFVALREAENAGIDAIVGALTEINYAMLGLLSLSIAFGLAAVVICAIRMFSDQPKSSPPGILYLVAGVPNLISPALIAYAWSVVVEVMTNRYTGNIVEAGAWIAQLCVAAIPVGIVTILILPVFSFVPFSARHGKKITSIAALAIVVIGIAAVAITFIGLADVLMSDPRVSKQ